MTGTCNPFKNDFFFFLFPPPIPQFANQTVIWSNTGGVAKPVYGSGGALSRKDGLGLPARTVYQMGVRKKKSPKDTADLDLYRRLSLQGDDEK